MSSTTTRAAAALTGAQPSPAPAWHRQLSREEIQDLLRIDDRRAWLSIAVNWGLVAASFALVALAPGVLTILIALFVIGARQLGFAVLMHEASHRTLLSDRRQNDLVGNWLCAYPVWSDLIPYRRYHLTHHAKNQTAEDPDLPLTAPFPITRASLRRKISRDLSGRTGIKFARGGIRRTLGAWRNGDPVGRRAFIGFVVTNAALLGMLGAVGHPELYLLWAGAWLTTHTLVTRIRAIAEHSMVPDLEDPLRNTRTTVARWWERLLIAPNRVNYHLEHHLLMTVPHYNLPRLHALLEERGVLGTACIAHGYPEVLDLASSRA
jgi:fatty acid desaturase